jgi:hypothetical protein
MKRRLIALALMVSMALGMARPAYAMFDKVRFATDLGVAFFAFHHWVYKPYQEQAFSAGAPHRTKALVKGGVALLFTLNRLKAANKIVHNTKDPALMKLGGMLDGLTSSFSNVGQRMKGGQFRPDEVNSLNSTVNGITSSAASSGIQVKDVPIAIPGT